MTLNVERRDEDLRRFVGSNSDYFLRKWQKYRNGGSIFGWNWPALFLGAGWLGYRKMYTEAWLIIGAGGFAHLVPSGGTFCANDRVFVQ